MAKKPRIYIIDVTNRDGVQTSRICLSKLQKTMINICRERPKKAANRPVVVVNAKFVSSVKPRHACRLGPSSAAKDRIAF